MISWMQKHRKYLVVTIWISTIAFVGAGFVGWGAYSYNQDRTNAVAKVGDVKISVKELQSSYSNLYNYYNQMLGGQLTREKAEQLHLQDIALNQLIRESLLINYAKEHGITALPEEVAARIRSIEAFQEGGKFDKKRYFQVLRSIGTDVKTFEKGIDKEIIITKLNRLLALPGTPLEAKMLFAATQMQDQLSVKTVTVDPADINISDAEIRAFWEKNRSGYLSKKSYELEAIKVAVDTIEVGDEALKSYYDAHKTLFKNAEEKILPFEEAKERVRKKVQMKKAKTEALKKYLAFKHGKITADRNITVEEGSSEIPLEKIRTANVGSFIKTIELPDGYMTVRLVAVKKPAPLSYEEAKEPAKRDLLAQKEKTVLAERAKEALKKAEGFKDVGYVSREDAAKLDFLSPQEAAQFLEHLFTAKEKSGYMLLGNKAVVYQIRDQKLFDEARYAKVREKMLKSAGTLKQNTMQESLIRELQKRYTIEKFIKG